jgi:uncharacterized hydantoinase/oxoprolinase family protein
MQNKEQIYDQQIQPLVDKITEIAKENSINILIAVDIGENDFYQQQIASTALLFENCHNIFLNIKHVLFDGYKIEKPEKELTEE